MPRIYRSYLYFFVYVISFFMSFAPAYAVQMDIEEDGWTDLFNGDNLDNWIQRNGEATYHIDGNAIVGTTMMNTPNSFLCTTKDYGDFILEFEVLIDPVLNSGVQIRSESKADYNNGRVHGYQIELDPSPRAWTAGIYDEARRGWLYSLTRNEAASKAFMQGRWNTIRVEAIGPSIRTWINGVMAANLVDDMTPAGFIALQVHGIGNENQAGKEIRWRNIRIKTDSLSDERWAAAPDVPVFNYMPNTLTDEETRKGWRLLWDGHSLDGWRSAQRTSSPEVGWRIADDNLSLLGPQGPDNTRGGDLLTTDIFSEFELEFDFMLSKGANSGIKYFVAPDLAAYSLGLEYQLIDDASLPESDQGVGGNHLLGSLYELIPAENLSLIGSGKRFNGIGRWNRGRIVVNGHHVEHWLNNEKLVSYERGTPVFRALMDHSKYAGRENFGEAPAGHILLQDHGNPVSFRNIKIREF